MSFLKKRFKLLTDKNSNKGKKSNNKKWGGSSKENCGSFFLFIYGISIKEKKIKIKTNTLLLMLKILFYTEICL